MDSLASLGRSRCARQTEARHVSVMRAFVVLGIFLLSSGPSHALDGGDWWDWYTGMSPYEQCMDYLAGDTDIESVLNEDFTGCGDRWDIPDRSSD